MSRRIILALLSAASLSCLPSIGAAQEPPPGLTRPDRPKYPTIFMCSWHEPRGSVEIRGACYLGPRGWAGVPCKCGIRLGRVVQR
jgi:hypothetical protein